MRKAKKKGVGFGFEIEFANVLTCFIIIPIYCQKATYKKIIMSRSLVRR